MASEVMKVALLSGITNTEKVLLTGNPVRNMIKEIDNKKSKINMGLSPDKFTILIIGGSQGSMSINEHFINNYEKYLNKDFQIIWQIGKNSNKIKDRIIDSRIKIFEFINKMDNAYSASDLVVSRAGATAISEILYLGKPSILIPFPFAANNHQEVNAKALDNKGASIMVKEDELNGGKLETLIFELSKSDNKINLYKENAKKCSISNSAYLIKEKVKGMMLDVR